MQAWIFRARDVGVLPAHAAQEMFRRFRAQGRHRQEPGTPYPFEEPRRMTRLVLRALAEEMISERRAAELLGQSLDAWQYEEPAPHGADAILLRG